MAEHLALLCMSRKELDGPSPAALLYVLNPRAQDSKNQGLGSQLRVQSVFSLLA